MTLSFFTVLFVCSTTLEPDWPGKLTALIGSMYLLWSRSSVVSLPTGLLRILTIPALLLCLGLHGFYNHALYDAGKDVWFFSGPLLYTAFGYLVYERVGTWQRLAPPLVVAGVFESLITIVQVIFHRQQLLTAGSIEDYRHVSGLGNFLQVVPTVLLLLMIHVKMPVNGILRLRMVRIAIYSLSAIAVCITFSRSMITCLAAALVCIVSLRSTPRQIRNYTAVLLTTTCAVLVGSGLFHNHKIAMLVDGFIDKTAHTSSEVTVHNYETYQDINMNWRGFEASRAATQFSHSGDVEKLFGEGFGALIDIGFAMKLGDSGESFQFIPLLHNGYMELLVKTGIIGLCLFFTLCMQIALMAIRELRGSGPCAKLNGLFLSWTVFVLVLTQGTIDGILYKNGLAENLFVLGAAAASIQLRARYSAAGSTFRTSRYIAYVPSAT